jgi:hypothetical protein
VLRWLRQFLTRFALFSVFVIGAARAYSWLFGYDDEMKAWAAQNRPIIALVLVLSAIMYAMYVWLDEDHQ